MNGEGQGEDFSVSEQPATLVDEIRLALGFLTILPVIDSAPAAEETVAASFAWFPLVGFAIGLALCVEDWFLGIRLGLTIRSVIDVLSLTIVTGAIHLDALADTADALGARTDRTRALEIMRDSRIGTYGTLALIFDLTFKLIALATLTRWRRYAALFFAPGLARWAMVSVTQGIEYLRPSGAGTTLVGSGSGRRMFKAGVTVAIALALVLSPRAIAATLLALIVPVLIRSFYARWLGGITGDMIGACGEIVEVIAFVVMASRATSA
jgi:adenosylcobinamide-GDP ribazoletransferase